MVPCPLMWRLAARLFTICSAASLVLCVGLCILWASSYSRSQGVYWQWWRGEATPRPALYCAASRDGSVLLLRSPRWMVHAQLDAVGRCPPALLELVGAEHDVLRDGRTFPGFGIGRGPEIIGDGFYSRGSAAWMMPHWLPAALLATGPVGWAWRRAARQRRRKHGHCVSCGFDLRASPGRCPECGAVPAAEGRN